MNHCPSHDWDRHADAQESAAQYAYLASMLRRRQEAKDIRGQIQRLEHRLAEISKEICADLGIAPGDEIDDKSTPWGRGKVVSCVGKVIAFDDPAFALPSDPKNVRMIAMAECEVAPATRDGYHATRRVSYRYMDERENIFTEASLADDDREPELEHAFSDDAPLAAAPAQSKEGE